MPNAKTELTTEVRVLHQGHRPRPPILETDLPRVRRMASLGMNVGQIAAIFGYSRKQFLTLRKRYPELDAAFTGGIAEGLELVTGKLRDAIDEGNLAAIIFFLKTRAGWSPTNPNPSQEEDSADAAPAEDEERSSGAPATVEDLFTSWDRN